MRSSSDPIRFSSGKANFQKFAIKQTHALLKVATKQHRVKFKKRNVKNMTFDLLYVTFLGIANEWSKAKDDFEQTNHKPYHLTMFDYARTIDGFDEMVRYLIDSEIERGERCVNPTRFDIIIDYDILGEYKPNIDKNSEENAMKMCFRNVVIRSVCEIYYDYESEWIDHVSTVRIDNHNGTFSTKIIIDLIAPISTLIKMTDLPYVDCETWTNNLIDNMRGLTD